MRPDQLQMLNDLSEKLADVFITEADPANWSGDGEILRDMSREERGNRHFDKKNAFATGSLLRSVLDLKDGAIKSIVNDPEMQEKRDAYLDAKLKEAERRADQARDRVIEKAKASAKG